MLHNLLPRLTFCLSLVLISSQMSWAQISTQRIKGRLLDQETGEPIEGAEIELMNYVPLKIVSTNEFGEYELRGIPLGVYRLLIIQEQYQTTIVPELELVQVQPCILNIKMKKEVFAESIGSTAKEEEERKLFTERDYAINNRTVSGSVLYDADLQQRFAGSYDDVLQLVSNTPGIRPTNSYLNELSIRGHHPFFTTFQVEGIDVANINQLSYPNSSTGAFSMLAPSMVDNFDILRNGLSAEHGRVAVGLVDARLRTGNEQQRTELDLSVSPLWGEVSFETPLNRERGQSLVLGYRHSFMNYLNQLAIPKVDGLRYPLNQNGPRFQNAFFKVDLPHTYSGDFQFFGLWSMGQHEGQGGELWPDDNKEYQQGFLQALLGARQIVRIRPKIHMKTTLGATYDQQDLYIQSPDWSDANSYQQQQLTAQLQSELEFIINRENHFHLGIEGDYNFLNLQQQRYGTNQLNYQGHTFYSQLYGFLYSQIHKNIKVNLGGQFQYLQLNQSFNFSPRLGMRWELGNHNLTLDAGIYQQQLPWAVYLQSRNTSPDNSILPNINLPFVRNNQVNLGYQWRFGEQWLMSWNAYFQYWDNIPIASDTLNTYFFLNQADYRLTGGGFPTLTDQGTGYHTGLEGNLEKFFDKGYYLNVSAAILDAKYFDERKQAFNARYNNQYQAVLLLGRELKFGPWGANSFMMNTRLLYSGGWYYTPIDLNASQSQNTEIRNQNAAWTVRTPDYWSWDIRLRLKIKNNKVTHYISLDANNLLNIRSPQGYFFSLQNSAGIQSWGSMGRTILVSYRFNFGTVKQSY